jgi:parallel beta-helix repeat protein
MSAKLQTCFKNSFLCLTTLFLLISLSPSICRADTSYISPPGTNLESVINNLNQGDTLILHDGDYYPSGTVEITVSGNSSLPITIRAENASGANIHGRMIWIKGNYVKLEGLEISDSSDDPGVWVNGDHNALTSLNIHGSYQGGVFLNGHHNLVEGCEIWQNGQINYGGNTPTGIWPVALSAYDDGATEYNTFRGNKVHDNWGEGIAGAIHTVIEDNVVYNNWAAGIYSINSPYLIIRRNLIYNTPDSMAKTQGRAYNAPTIPICDENQSSQSHHVIIVNNMVLGGDGNVYFWTQQAGTGLKHYLIAYNTFVNSVAHANFTIDAGSHQDTLVENNIFIQENSLDIVNIPGSGFTFSHNLWSKIPQNAAQGEGDVYLDANSASRVLALTGPTANGQLTADWFKLKNFTLPTVNPALNKGYIMSDSEIRAFCGSEIDANCFNPVKESLSTDFFGTPRSNPSDLGAYEYSADGGLTPTPPLAKAGDVNGDGKVNMVDIGIIANAYGTNPTGDTRADLNGDGVVNVVDLGIVIDNFGL